MEDNKNQREKKRKSTRAREDGCSGAEARSVPSVAPKRTIQKVNEFLYKLKTHLRGVVIPETVRDVGTCQSSGVYDIPCMSRVSIMQQTRRVDTPN